MAINFPVAILPQKPLATSGVSSLIGVDGSGALVRGATFAGNVKDFGATGDGTTIDTAAFTAAAAAHSVVYVPPGAYKLDGNIAGTTRWIIAKGVTFPEKTTVGNNGMQDTSRLGGRVFFFWDNGTRGGLYAGDPDLWVEGLRNPSASLAEIAGVSPTGCIGVLGASRSSDNPSVNQGTIGGEFQVLHDDTTNIKPAFGTYNEIRQNIGAGAILGTEIDTVVLGTADTLQPFTARSINSKDAIGMVIASGAEVVGAQKSSAAMAVWANGATFDRGIVFMNGSLDGASVMEAMAAQLGMKIAWYTSNGQQSWIKGDGSQFTAISDTAASGYQVDVYRKHANYTDATVNVDEIYRLNGYGYTGSANYLGAYLQFLQRTAFSGGNARYSVDLSAKNAAGTDIQVTLNGLADTSFAAFPDNTVNLGATSFRWKEIFCGNATINTSDQALKTDIRELTDAEHRVAQRCKGLLKSYRWKDAVATKGDDARIHFGAIAQEVEAAFTAEGLDGWKYSVLCSDPIMEMRTFSRPAKRPKTEPKVIFEDIIDIVDGRAVASRREKTIDAPVIETFPVVDEAGAPVMVPILQTVMKEMQDEDGEVRLKTVREVVGERQSTVDVPVMEEFEEDFEDVVETGERRLGIRYSELLAFILAAMD